MNERKGTLEEFDLSVMGEPSHFDVSVWVVVKCGTLCYEMDGFAKVESTSVVPGLVEQILKADELTITQDANGQYGVTPSNQEILWHTHKVYHYEDRRLA